MRTHKISSHGSARTRHDKPGSGFRIRALLAGAASLTLATAGCTSAVTSAGNTPVRGGTAVWAELASTPPNYIFPYEGSTYFSLSNANYFANLMYRPLYWFGGNGLPTANNSLSLASPPVFDGTKVTITLKHYRWSNGTPVTARDVMFWLNMELAVPADYGGYSGFPANVKDITVVSPSELTMTMDKAYSSTWFWYNDLSQITPMPAAWDRTASGPSACATTVRDCAAVYNYLNGQAKDLNTYATSPIWGIVDGPWRLSAFNADGHVTFVPNKSYSGPVKPKLAAFEEVPFTTDAAEYNVLQAGVSNGKIDVGYLPEVDAPARPVGSSPLTPGANPLAAKGYTLAPPYFPWGIGFYVLNFHSTTGNGPVIRQLYFRQVLAYLTNQAAVINGPLRGYGAPTVGPVPATPMTSFLSPKGRRGDPYPYNPGKAKTLLASHGWTVVPNGVSTCADPALCGPGIKKGQGLSLTFPYPSGVSWIALEMDQLQSSASLAGIRLNLRPEPFNELPGGNCVVTKSPCNWDGVAGIGWSYAPDYLPTGEALFMCGVPANAGGYCDKTNEAMINKTLTSGNLSYLYRWQDYLSAQLPVEWTPNPVWLLTEIASNLRGVLPQSPTLDLNPENWYFVK
jgi:peptide/nickel transport system substrate-binding protein